MGAGDYGLSIQLGRATSSRLISCHIGWRTLHIVDPNEDEMYIMRAMALGQIEYHRGQSTTRPWIVQRGEAQDEDVAECTDNR